MRATLLLGSLLVGFGALGGRLYDIQVKQHERYSDLARKQQFRVRSIPPWRGEVLAQEDGHPVALAGSVARGTLFVEAMTEKDLARGAERDPEDFLGRLESALVLTEDERDYVQDHLERNVPFFFRRRKLLPEDLERLRSVLNHRDRLRPNACDKAQVVEEPVRGYPFGSLAIQALGLVANVGSQSFQGQCGLEKTFEEQLRGVRGLREVELDNTKTELVDPASVEVEARPGLSLLTTIDRRIQAIVEEEVELLVAAWQPKGVACVVVDPHTGNVLAIASRPSFDPTDLGHAKPDAFRNRCLTDTYEPGSTIKPLVVGTAWDEGLGDPVRAIFCPHSWKLPGRRKLIEDAEHENFGMIDEAQVLVRSSNVGAVQIGSRLGMLKIRRALETFGLGRKTGIELPAEVAGDARNLAKTDVTTLGSVCQGYAVNVTPIQMAMAYAAIANGGTLYRPRIVAELRNSDGETVRRFEPVPLARVLSVHVAKDWLAKALERVVSDPHGTAHACKVPGYALAGKTGTTKKTVGGHYSERDAITSFCGFAPADDPRIALSVVVFEPSTAKGKVWGGTVAAPAASAIVGKTLKYLGVAPTPEQPAEKSHADESPRDD
jgi:cell division protein FtsI/penicillin-binding protein 2